MIHVCSIALLPKRPQVSCITIGISRTVVRPCRLRMCPATKPRHTKYEMQLILPPGFAEVFTTVGYADRTEWLQWCAERRLPFEYCVWFGVGSPKHNRLNSDGTVSVVVRLQIAQCARYGGAMSTETQRATVFV